MCRRIVPSPNVPTIPSCRSRTQCTVYHPVQMSESGRTESTSCRRRQRLLIYCCLLVHFIQWPFQCTVEDLILLDTGVKSTRTFAVTVVGMETVRKYENGYPKIFEISEFVSVRIRSVSIFCCCCLVYCCLLASKLKRQLLLTSWKTTLTSNS